MVNRVPRRSLIAFRVLSVRPNHDLEIHSTRLGEFAQEVFGLTMPTPEHSLSQSLQTRYPRLRLEPKWVPI